MIHISDLDFHYGGNPHAIFSNFSLSLEDNRVYGLLGKNGTGKSTLLYLISGLLLPNKGSISVDGYASQLRHPDMLQKLFIVPEEYDLPHSTLRQYVKISRGFYPRFSDEILRSSLAEFDLPMDLHLQSLSMGQKKKVYMSFALAANTKYLLMDEPTNGLDIPAKSQFRKVIANNMDSERTVLISTHQVRDVETLLDHILVIERSGLRLNLSVEEITRRYAFEMRPPGALTSDVLYAEASFQGNAVVAANPDARETSMNLELLFNAAIQGKL